ncbi:MAG TPA: indole-3-glycerol phosphate synthase TrpC [Acidimicrobiales bacterium]|jgi:indole-3-glycerol phosphate synthase|nr:indole-3-glycerol phosphate synthase TrpC [Acidimicrobiales bacterium]
MPDPAGTYLDRIVAAHRAAATLDLRPLHDLVAQALALPPARGFAAALRAGAADGQTAVIAEIKRRSPSKGDLFPDLDPAVLAKEYADGGAACLSVLTDQAFFGGSSDDLQAARAAVPLPVLRKDFTVGPADVCDARLMGADAVLLIAAALDDDELAGLHALAGEVGIEALVEVHDEAELARALAVGATLVGVNQRDLVTFEVDHDRARRMGGAMPESVVKVAESGVRDAADAAALRAAGYDAVLVGESLVTSGDPAAAVTALRTA